MRPLPTTQLEAQARETWRACWTLHYPRRRPPLADGFNAPALARGALRLPSPETAWRHLDGVVERSDSDALVLVAMRALEPVDGLAPLARRLVRLRAGVGGAAGATEETGTDTPCDVPGPEGPGAA